MVSRSVEKCRGSVEVVSIDTGVNGVNPCRPVSTRVRGQIDSLYARHIVSIVIVSIVMGSLIQ